MPSRCDDRRWDRTHPGGRLVGGLSFSVLRARTLLCFCSYLSRYLVFVPCCLTRRFVSAVLSTNILANYAMGVLPGPSTLYFPQVDRIISSCNRSWHGVHRLARTRVSVCCVLLYHPISYRVKKSSPYILNTAHARRTPYQKHLKKHL